MDKKIMTIVLASFILCSSLSAWKAQLETVGDIEYAGPVQEGMGCFTRGPPRDFHSFWIPTFSFDALLCSLALFRAYQSCKEENTRILGGRSLFSVMIRDSVLYFFVIAASYLFCVVMALMQPKLGVPVYGPGSFTVVLSGILSNRMLLNIRQTAADSQSSTILY